MTSTCLTESNSSQADIWDIVTDALRVCEPRSVRDTAGVARRSAGLLKRSERVSMSFTMAALLMSVAAAACHLWQQQPAGYCGVISSDSSQVNSRYHAQYKAW